MKQNKYERCIYPGCIGNVLPGKTTNRLCSKHTSQLEFLIWALNNIIIEKEKKTESGIILPNR